MSKKVGKKSKSRRSMNRYPALQKNLNLKTRRYYIEPDYIDGVIGISKDSNIRPLEDKEKAFLNQFYEEFIISSFRRDGTDLHKTDEQRKDLYKRNNQRNVCLYNLKQKTGQLQSFNADSYDSTVYDNICHLDYETILTNQLEVKEIAEEIIQMKEEFNLEFNSIFEVVRKKYPDFFHRSFTDKEIKDMGKSEIGETLYLEAKIILENQ